MDNLSEIIKKRLAPGVLIFDLHERLLYTNQEAMEMLAMLSRGEVSIPEEIYLLCRKLKRETESQESGQPGAPHCALLSGEGTPFSLRALLIGDHGGESRPTHIMVLMERVAERHEIDIDGARKEFQLSKREAEVVRFISRGLANREIAETMFISEYTVKDHIKNIMKKMGAGSRNEIIALLK